MVDNRRLERFSVRLVVMLSLSMYGQAHLAAQELSLSLSASSIEQYEPLYVSVSISNNTSETVRGALSCGPYFERQEPGGDWSRCTPWQEMNAELGEMRVSEFAFPVYPGWIDLELEPGASEAYEFGPIDSPLVYNPGTYRILPIYLRSGGRTYESNTATFTVRPCAANASHFTDRRAYHEFLWSWGVPSYLDEAFVSRVYRTETVTKPIRDFAAILLAERSFCRRDYAASASLASFAIRSSVTLSTGGIRGIARYMRIRARWHLSTTVQEFDAATADFRQLVVDHPELEKAHSLWRYSFLREHLPERKQRPERQSPSRE